MATRMTQQRRADAPQRITRSFTLIELLVVVSIIAVLAAMLLPVLSKARGRVMVTSCLNNMKQGYMALQMYGTDMEEYPTNFTRDIAPAGNWGDENCGRWQGGPRTSGTVWTSTDTNTRFPGSSTPAVDLMLNAGYGKKQYLACSIDLKSEANYNKGGWYFGMRTWDNRNTGTYVYNGPHTGTGNLKNNADMSGMATMSMADKAGSTQKGEAWGISFKEDVVLRRSGQKFSLDRIGFLGCPSIYRDDNRYREPHDYSSGLSMPYVVQFDYTNRGWLARNFIFGDGHAGYIYSGSRTGYVPE